MTSPTNTVLVVLKVSGGFAGIRREAKADVTEAAETIQKAVKSAWESVPKARKAAGRDLVQYKILIRKGKEKRELVFDSLSLPRGVEPLLHFLMQKAGPVRGKRAG